MHVFFNGYNTTISKNFVYELHLDTGAAAAHDFNDTHSLPYAASSAPTRDAPPGFMTNVAHVPGIVQVCINAYSSKTQTFYLTAQSDDRTGNKVAGVRRVTCDV